jgi:hypothetical protein
VVPTGALPVPVSDWAILACAGYLIAEFSPASAGLSSASSRNRQPCCFASALVSSANLPHALMRSTAAAGIAASRGCALALHGGFHNFVEVAHSEDMSFNGKAEFCAEMWVAPNVTSEVRELPAGSVRDEETALTQRCCIRRRPLRPGHCGCKITLLHLKRGVRTLSADAQDVRRHASVQVQPWANGPVLYERRA